MPIYTYFCKDHGELEIEHSIKENVDICPTCISDGRTDPIVLKRLISGGTGFQLLGSGWYKDGYSKK